MGDRGSVGGVQTARFAGRERWRGEARGTGAQAGGGALAAAGGSGVVVVASGWGSGGVGWVALGGAEVHPPAAGAVRAGRRLWVGMVGEPSLREEPPTLWLVADGKKGVDSRRASASHV